MRFLSLLAIVFFLFFAEPEGLFAGTLRVVATFSIPADWVREIGGDKVEIVPLLPPNSDPHSYHPTRQDVLKLRQADLIVGISPNAESWLNALVTSKELLAKTVWLESALANARSTDDPHLWMDIQLAANMTALLAEKMARADPQSAPVYRKAAARYAISLHALDTWAQNTLKSIPGEKRVLLACHDNLRRLAERYELRFAAAMTASSDAETRDPSAAKLSAFVKQATQHKVPVFYDSDALKKLAIIVSRDAKLPPPVRLHTDSLPNLNGASGSYLQTYENNVRLIAKALGAKEIPPLSHPQTNH